MYFILYFVFDYYYFWARLLQKQRHLYGKLEKIQVSFPFVILVRVHSNQIYIKWISWTVDNFIQLFLHFYFLIFQRKFFEEFKIRQKSEWRYSRMCKLWARIVHYLRKKVQSHSKELIYDSCSKYYETRL